MKNNIINEIRNESTFNHINLSNRNSKNFEVIKNLIMEFYPKEDEYFFNLILSPSDDSNFLIELEKFYKNIKSFSDEDPENKFYGVQNITKIPKSDISIEHFELNKKNTDLIFVLVEEILLNSYEEKFDKKSLIKGKINEIFNCNNLNSIGFISNKLENYTSSFPVNFYAFCTTLKILLLCYPQQIKNFHFGLFLNSDQTLFDSSNNNCFLYELFCSYLVFLHLSSNILLNEVSTLSIHFFDDSNIFENFTFHVNNNGYNIIKKIIPKIEKYDILNLLKELFNNIVYRISIYLHYKLSINAYKKVLDFINFGEFPKKLHIYCDKSIINDKNINLIKEITNSKELNIHIISNISLVNTNVENKISLKNEDIINFRNFFLEGKNIYVEKISPNMGKIKSLKLINNKSLYYIEDETQYKNLHNNICFNFPNEIFNNLAYLEELELKHITPEQFFLLVNSLNADNMKYYSSILKLYLEINYSHLKILSSINTGISRSQILGAVDSLIRNSKRISEIRKLEITLSNDNPQNNFLLTKQNGFYFISSALELLKRCYIFSLKNINNYYYPPNDVKPEIKQRASNNRIRNFRAKSKEIIGNNEEFCLNDDVHNCRVQTNSNKDLQVIYNGSEFNDIVYTLDLENVIPFLYTVKKKLIRLKPKALLINIVKFFDIKAESPRQFSVCNFNN